MSINVTVESSMQPLWTDPNVNGKGKFYGIIICRVEDQPAGVTYFVPVWNWGAGAYRGHTSGQLGMGKFHGSPNAALQEAQHQQAKKQNGGYSTGYFLNSPCPTNGSKPPQKVVDLLTGHLGAATVVQAPATGHSILTPAPRPGSSVPLADTIEAYVNDFEGLATRVLTTGDLEKALDQLTSLKQDFALFTEQYERAEGALELANMQVMSRLRK